MLNVRLRCRAAIVFAATTGCSAAASASRTGAEPASVRAQRGGAADGGDAAASADTASAAEAAGAPTPAECRNTQIDFDAATPLGVSARQVLRSLHADGQRFALREDHLGFFQQVGLTTPRPQEATKRHMFSPTAVVTYAAPCSSRTDLAEGQGLVALAQEPHGPRLLISGSVTVTLSRGATLTSPAGLIIDLSNPAAPSTTAMGLAEYSGHRVQIAWQLGTRSHSTTCAPAAARRSRVPGFASECTDARRATPPSRRARQCPSGSLGRRA